MQDIKVDRYEKATPEERKTWGKNVREIADDWQGYIEPKDKSWILFIDIKGKPVLFPKRNKKTGAVIGEALS